MQQHSLQEPSMHQPMVFLIVGRSGVGKTELVKQLVEQSAGRMSYLAPDGLHSTFSHEQDWRACDVLAFDELSQWDQDTLRPGFFRLETEARQHGKKLILILQDRTELEQLGIKLRDEPAVLEITRPGTGTLTYRGVSASDAQWLLGSFLT